MIKIKTTPPRYDEVFWEGLNVMNDMGGDVEIIKGWRFYAADFSLQAGGKAATGCVTLVRDPEEKARWHKMPDEMKEDNGGPPLYVRGHGTTVEGAVADALWAAVFAAPIPDSEG